MPPGPTVETGGKLKVGGQALPDGVLMRTERAWAVARADGSVVSGELPAPRWPRIPVIRVLASLGQGLRLGLTGMAGEAPGRTTKPWPWRLWRALLGAEAAVIALDWLLGLLHPEGWGQPLIIVALWVAAIGAFRLLSPAVQWRYHGAEHKAVTAYEHGVDLGDTNRVLSCSRIHSRCGTNLMVWLILLSPLLARLPWLGQLVGLPAAVAAVAEVLTLVSRRPDSVLAKAALAPGRLLQAWVTTEEPGTAEQRVGCAALAACLDRHGQTVDKRSTVPAAA